MAVGEHRCPSLIVNNTSFTDQAVRVFIRYSLAALARNRCIKRVRKALVQNTSRRYFWICYPTFLFLLFFKLEFTSWVAELCPLGFPLRNFTIALQTHPLL